jgi:C-terminal processing protease CtpA/Prc
MRYFPAVLAVFVFAGPTLGHAQEPRKVDCHKDLRKAVEFIDAQWSFKIFKPGAVDFDEAYRELQWEARNAETPEACADVLARFMAQLGDGHSRLQYFPGLEYSAPAIELRSQRERLSSRPGEKARVHVYVFSRDTTDDVLRTILPGSEILAVNGEPVDERYRFMEERAAGSTPQWIDYMCDRQLLLGPAGLEVELSMREPSGSPKTVVVTRPPYLSEDEREREDEIYEDTFQVAVWERLEGGWGYLQYKSFAFKNYDYTIDAFDDAIDDLIDTPGLIIDLRGNGGGYVDAMADAAGRFVDERFAVEYFQVRAPGQETVIEYLDPLTQKGTTRPPVVSKPRKDIYVQPLVILIDHRCFSACEGFSGGLQSIGRALVVGNSASGGGSGWVAGIRLPSRAIISFSWTVAWRPDGTQIEGNGVVPDILVRERPRDWASGRDRVLERAIRALQQGEAKPLASASGTH